MNIDQFIDPALITNKVVKKCRIKKGVVEVIWYFHSFLRIYLTAGLKFYFNDVPP